MGQYGNQPDFGTIATTAVIQGDPTSPSTVFNLKPAALYIGTGGTLICRVVGDNADNFGGPESGYTIFKNIPDGTFFL